ncbi:MAG TPA: hypothetical protein VI968_03780 [archaeon]|nr:hypothetical protein [archaeon]
MHASTPVKDEMKGTYSAAVLKRDNFYSILRSESCAVFGKDFDFELARCEEKGSDVLAVYRGISFQAVDRVAHFVSRSNPSCHGDGFIEDGPTQCTLYPQSYWDNLFS